MNILNEQIRYEGIEEIEEVIKEGVEHKTALSFVKNNLLNIELLQKFMFTICIDQCKENLHNINEEINKKNIKNIKTVAINLDNQKFSFTVDYIFISKQQLEENLNLKKVYSFLNKDGKVIVLN